MSKRGHGGVMLNKYSRKRSSPSPSPPPLPPPSPSPSPVKTMSRDFSRDKISVVFWDVEDCPIPDGHDSVWVYQKVESALVNEGYCCKGMEIRVYSGKNNEITEESFYQYLSAGLYYKPGVSGDTCARVNEMLRDILIWTFDNTIDDYPGPSNLMVISKKISEDTKFRRVLQALKSRDYNVLFVQPEKVSSKLLLPFVRSVWLWKSLLDGEKPFYHSGSSQCVGNTSGEGVANKCKLKKGQKRFSLE